MFAPNCGQLDRDESETISNSSQLPDYCQVLRFKDANGQVKEMVFPKALDLDRPKRPRTTFSDSQLTILEKEFQRNPYLVGKDRTRLASSLDLTETQIKVWFQNRRTKSKKDKVNGDTDKDKRDNDSSSWTSSSPDCASPKVYPLKPLPISTSSTEECSSKAQQYLNPIQIPVAPQLQNPMMYSSNFGALPYMYSMFPVTQMLRR